MISLEKSEKFQSEYNEWLKKAESIDNMRAKAELDGLLEQMLNEVRKIDRCHISLLVKNGIAEDVNESRKNLLNIRKKIDKILKSVSN